VTTTCHWPRKLNIWLFKYLKIEYLNLNIGTVSAWGGPKLRGQERMTFLSLFLSSRDRDGKCTSVELARCVQCSTVSWTDNIFFGFKCARRHERGSCIVSDLTTFIYVATRTPETAPPGEFSATSWPILTHDIFPRCELSNRRPTLNKWRRRNTYIRIFIVVIMRKIRPRSGFELESGRTIIRRLSYWATDYVLPATAVEWTTYLRPISTTAALRCAALRFAAIVRDSPP